MAHPIAPTSPAGSPEFAAHTAFTNAESLEEQVGILATLLQRKETDYNRSNPTETPKNRITVSPDYEAGQLNMTVDLLLTSDAVQRALTDAIVAHIPA